MIRDNLINIEKLSNGRGLLDKFAKIEINGVSTDTRQIKKDNLYIPISGEKFNGHDFIEEAIKNGASASLWSKDVTIPQIDFPFILVDDTLLALQNLAKNYRESLKNITIIGITGSNGKTTTKDILEGILSRKYKTQKTQGNLNNQIGLPLTLLSLDKDTEIGIIEMGTDGFGQISELTHIAQPDIAMITNIGDSHLDLLKNKENVGRAKFEILEGLNLEGLFIYNNDDPILDKLTSEYSINQKILNFGKKENSNFKLELVEEGRDGIRFNVFEDGQKYSLHIPMLGRHNIYNAGASIIAARYLDLDYKTIQDGLYNIQATDMRNEIIETDRFTILNDAYKSNPDSLLAALDTLYSIEGYEHKALVLGDMLDLGENIVELHKNVGSKIDPNKVDKIFTFGDLAKHISDGARPNFKDNQIYHSTSKEELKNSILSNIDEDSLILVKASRGVALEELINNLIK